MTAAALRPEVLLLLFVLIFSPLAFGTVEPWSHAIAGGVALVGLAVALHRRTRDGLVHLRAVPGGMPLLLFLGFLLLQLLPLPPALLRLVSPAAHARWDAALGAAGPLPWLPISLDPLATMRELVRLSACAALYALTVQLLARRERLRAVTTALAVFAAALAFEAILQFLVAPGRLLFVRTAPSLFPFGPFVNRNHYANLMAMLAPVLFSLFLARGRRPGARAPHGLRERLVELLARPEANLRLLLGFAALLCAASLVISLSRGAMVALAAALAVFGACLASRGIGQGRLAAAAAFFFALLVFVGWFGWVQVAERFATVHANPGLVDAMRAGPWQDTLRMAADFPVLGAGIGSFERLYPGYRAVPGTLATAHAHNDYLELLAGGGAVGLGLFAWFVAAVLLAVVRACRQRHDRSALFLAFGSLAGCVAFLVHGAADFSLAIGANALYFFFLLGLAVSASHTRGQADDQGTLLPLRRLPARASWAVAALAAIAVLVSGADLTARRAWGRAADVVRRAEALRVPPPSARGLLQQAARLQPLEAAYPAALARIAALEGKPDEALLLTRRALRLLPIDPACLMQLGTLLAAAQKPGPARRSFAAAIAADPTSSRNRERFGAWLLSQDDRAEAAAQLREAMALDPARSPGIFSLLVLAGFDDARVAAVVPPHPEALLQFARYATATGATRFAIEAYRRVLALDPDNRQAATGLERAGAPR